MRIYAFAIYLFLYLPIGIIALFSFSAGRSASQLQGFSTQWYSKALDNPFVIDALKTSASVALTSAFLSCLLGTMAAIALTGLKGKLRVLFDALIYIAVMIPGIVIGIATLIALVTVFNTVNPRLQAVTGLKLFGIWLAHSGACAVHHVPRHHSGARPYRRHGSFIAGSFVRSWCRANRYLSASDPANADACDNGWFSSEFHLQFR